MSRQMFRNYINRIGSRFVVLVILDDMNGLIVVVSMRIRRSNGSVGVVSWAMWVI